jgi:hypothetical protein
VDTLIFLISLAQVIHPQALLILAKVGRWSVCRITICGKVMRQTKVCRIILWAKVVERNKACEITMIQTCDFRCIGCVIVKWILLRLWSLVLSPRPLSAKPEKCTGKGSHNDNTYNAPCNFCLFLILLTTILRGSTFEEVEAEELVEVEVEVEAEVEAEAEVGLLDDVGPSPE